MEHQQASTSPLYIVRQQWQMLKDKERNLVAAFFHMCSCALVCTSLAALGWFRLRGAPCTPHLAPYQFFSYGHFSMDANPSIPEIVSSKAVSRPLISQYHSSSSVLSCVTPEVASLMRVVILLCFLALGSAFAGFLLDIWGASKPILQIVRRASLPSILTVLWVASIVGACYNLTMMLQKSITHLTPAFYLRVNYEYGIYTISAAGACALAATASNLLSLQPPVSQSDGQTERLVDDWDGLETFSINADFGDTPLNAMPSPPPYTP
ncbi:transmembrane protein 127-like [Cloeon dipterum]|uniref:transmembrane protein 127-like n=1 Tax=Cloeon dipterum TaxID=197152 RepID=UPI00321F6A0E